MMVYYRPKRTYLLDDPEAPPICAIHNLNEVLQNIQPRCHVGLFERLAEANFIEIHALSIANRLSLCD